jgi:hypothetical protein
VDLGRAPTSGLGTRAVSVAAALIAASCDGTFFRHTESERDAETTLSLGEIRGVPIVLRAVGSRDTTSGGVDRGGCSCLPSESWRVAWYVDAPGTGEPGRTDSAHVLEAWDLSEPDYRTLLDDLGPVERCAGDDRVAFRFAGSERVAERTGGRFVRVIVPEAGGRVLAAVVRGASECDAALAAE